MHGQGTRNQTLRHAADGATLLLSQSLRHQSLWTKTSLTRQKMNDIFSTTTVASGGLPSEQGHQASVRTTETAGPVLEGHVYKPAVLGLLLSWFCSVGTDPSCSTQVLEQASMVAGQTQSLALTVAATGTKCPSALTDTDPQMPIVGISLRLQILPNQGVQELSSQLFNSGSAFMLRQRACFHLVAHTQPCSALWQ